MSGSFSRRTSGARGGRRLRRLAVVVTLLVASLVSLQWSTVAGAVAPTVAVVPSPDVTVGTPPEITANVLNSVSADSPTDIWAVGTYNRGTSTAPVSQTLIEHFDGTNWTTVPSPDQINLNGATTDNVLLAVSADSSTDAWAVGYYVDLNGFGYPVDQLLVEHFNGISWSLLPSIAQPFDAPGSRSAQNQFLAVDAVSASDVWAVGEYHNGSDPLTLVERYNGTSWSVVASPDPGTTVNVLQSVSSDGGTGLFAVGYSASNTTDQTLIEHYDGTAWSVVASPDAGTAAASQLTGVTSDSPTDAWAVGTTGGTSATPVDQTLIEHYNGTAWSVVPSPDTSATAANRLAGISADAPTDVWAVGTSVGGTSTDPVDRTLILHYDGTSWLPVASPDTGTAAADQLNGAVALSPTDLWTVGTASGAGTAQTLIEGTPPASITAVTSSVATPVTGQAVTYTATVSGSATAPAGTVAFSSDGVLIAGCDAVPLSAASATCTATAGSAGNHSIVASYGGDAVHLASSGLLAVTVGQASTFTVLSAQPSSPVFGQPMVLTATVAVTAPGSGVPTGTVAFSDSGTAIAGCGAQTLVRGTAACTYTPASPGPHSLSSLYNGSTDDVNSTAPTLDVTVTAAASVTAVTSSQNPSSAGQTVSYTATVGPVAPATGTPSGVVTFDNGGTPIAGCSSLALVAGAAKCMTDMPLAGSFLITVTYGGSSAFASSESPAEVQVVQAGPLTVQEVQASGNPTANGVTLSPVGLGTPPPGPSSIPIAYTGGQFGGAVGNINTVTVTDDRGTEPGWTVTAQLENGLTNQVPVGPPSDNTIPADFLTWSPAAVTGAAGDRLAGVSAGPASTLSSSTPAVLCRAASGSGGGAFSCTAALALAVPPYVAAGSYAATLVIITS